MSENDDLNYVLDAWAILAFFEGEPAGKIVFELLKKAEAGQCALGVSLINVGEVAYITERERGLARAYEALATLHSFPLTVLSVDEEIVMTAAHIKANNRLSYADAFAAATAQTWNAKLLTGDPELKALDGQGLTIEWLSG